MPLPPRSTMRLPGTLSTGCLVNHASRARIEVAYWLHAADNPPQIKCGPISGDEVAAHHVGKLENMLLNGQPDAVPLVPILLFPRFKCSGGVEPVECCCTVKRWSITNDSLSHYLRRISIMLTAAATSARVPRSLSYDHDGSSRNVGIVLSGPCSVNVHPCLSDVIRPGPLLPSHPGPNEIDTNAAG